MWCPGGTKRLARLIGLCACAGAGHRAIGNGGRSASSSSSGTSKFSGVWISSPPTSDSVQIVSLQAGISSGREPEAIVGFEPNRFRC